MSLDLQLAKGHTDSRSEIDLYLSDSLQPEHPELPTLACRPVLLVPTSLGPGDQGEPTAIESENLKR